MVDFSNFALREVVSVSLILFSVIDIIGSIPIILNLKEKGVKIQSTEISVAAGFLMIMFLFVGKSILTLFGVDVQSFAIAGAIVIFLIGLEMILGIHIFKVSNTESSSSSIVPIAFPLVAGAGTLTTILTLKAEFKEVNILIGIVINLFFVFLVLKLSDKIQNLLGKQGEEVLRKVFGIILLAISVKLVQSNW